MTHESKLDQQARRFLAGEITNWEYYETTRNFRVVDVARAAGVAEHVVRTRRRDLRKMREREAIREHARRQVATFPPLSAAQRAQLAAIIAGVRRSPQLPHHPATPGDRS